MATTYLGFPAPPALPQTPDFAALANWLRVAVPTLNAMLLGRLNAVGTVTLTPSVASTTVNDPRVSADSHIDLSPLTANAQAMTWRISTKTAGASFVVTHTNDANTGKDFTYSIIG